jgi:hypothetical protein
MAAGTTPIFVDTPDGAFVNFAVANTGRDGTGTIATLHVAGADGSYFRRFRVQATVTTSAGWSRLERAVNGEC